MVATYIISYYARRGENENILRSTHFSRSARNVLYQMQILFTVVSMMRENNKI